MLLPNNFRDKPVRYVLWWQSQPLHMNKPNPLRLSIFLQRHPVRERMKIDDQVNSQKGHLLIQRTSYNKGKPWLATRVSFILTNPKFRRYSSVWAVAGFIFQCGAHKKTVELKNELNLQGHLYCAALPIGGMNCFRVDSHSNLNQINYQKIEYFLIYWQ